MTVLAVGGFVKVRAEWVAKIVTKWIGPEGWIDNGEVVFRDVFGVVAVFGVETFLEGIIHGVDGGLATLIAVHGFDVGVLDEKEDENQ